MNAPLSNPSLGTPARSEMKRLLEHKTTSRRDGVLHRVPGAACGLMLQVETRAQPLWQAAPHPGLKAPTMKRRDFIAGLAGAAAWPIGAPGQQTAMPIIGFLSSLAPEGAVPLVAAFRGGLSASGYVEGKNVAIEYRWARGDYDRLPVLARELVATRAAVLATTGGEPAAIAARAASSNVPVVFMVGGDPVKLGLVASYNHPGSNATGINLLTEAMEPKRLGILRELLPQAPMIAVLVNPKFPPAELQAKEIEAAAGSFGMQAEVFRATARHRD